MNQLEERIKNIEKEQFYFYFIDGTFMPNNKNYTKIIMFEDVFNIENEIENKEYVDIYYILKTKKFLQENKEKIIRMSRSMTECAIKSSYQHEFSLKLDNELYKCNCNLCNEEGKKLYNEFVQGLYDILEINNDINKKALIKSIDSWKENNSAENFKDFIQNVIKYNFYCPIKDNNGTQIIATIKNSKGETLLPAFSDKNELNKWIKIENKNIKRLNFKQYANILLSKGNTNIGLVINPLGANIVLDKKIVSDIIKTFYKN